MNNYEKTIIENNIYPSIQQFDDGMHLPGNVNSVIGFK